MGSDDAAPYVEPGPRREAYDFGLDILAVRELVYSPAERVVLDERPADEFFSAPRIGAAHTDEHFTRSLTALYRRILAPHAGGGATWLDLCSSSSSHLPPDLIAGQVIGHGMNGAELQANGRLTSRLLQDLNQRTSLPVGGESVAAVLCCNGIQYLTRPEWVLLEVARVLRPGGCVVVAFSTSCWPERAAAGWLGRDSEGRIGLVERLLENAGLRVVEVVRETSGGPGADPLFALIAQKEPAAAAVAGAGDAGAEIAAEWSPTQVANAVVGPALREMDLRPADMAGAAPLTLDRWRMSYKALVEDAVDLGVPRSVIPQLPADASPGDIRAARDHLQSMIESFLSASL